MDNWVTIAIIVVIVIFMIGNLSTVHKNSSMPLRKKGLNDLKETLPRTNKDTTNTHSFSSSEPIATKPTNKKNSD